MSTKKPTIFKHLTIHNLRDFDTSYLFALILDDKDAILRHESIALGEGYGPLQVCSFTESPSSQKALCRKIVFQPTTLIFGSFKSLKRFGIAFQMASYAVESSCVDQPENAPQPLISIRRDDLTHCPNIFIICKNPHSHPNPFPTKTPPSISRALSDMLVGMNWELADATPRNIMTNSGFTDALRRHLGWKHSFGPALSDLHPSLGNLDHVRRLIDDLRLKIFPSGTGFEGLSTNSYCTQFLF